MSSSGHMRQILIAHQVAISFALLVAIGLVARAQHAVLDPRLPYDPSRILTVSVDLGREGYSPLATRSFFNSLVSRVTPMLSEGSPALASSPPVGVVERSTIQAVGRSVDLSTSIRGVSAPYFKLLGLRLVDGRVFQGDESTNSRSEVPVVLSEPLARAIWPSGGAVGRTVTVGNGFEARVVGVVESESAADAEDDNRILYHPIYSANSLPRTVLIPVSGDTRRLIDAVRTEVRRFDPQVTVQPLTVAGILIQQSDRLGGLIRVVALPAGLALALALVGLYGVSSYAASQRAQEIGIRLALGARPYQVVALLLSSLRWPLIGGLVAGIPIAALGGRMLVRARLLPDINVFDVYAHGGVLVLLVVAVVLATIVPAVAAARTPPWEGAADR